MRYGQHCTLYVRCCLTHTKGTNHIMKKIHVNAINRKVRDDEKLFVAECDRKYNDKLIAIADSIEEQHNEKPILLLAGPSGAGKTTTALKIEEILDSRGIHTHSISMDDYFLPADSFTVAIGEDGKPDYESPDRIDRKLLYEHMEKINSGEEVVLPKFEFSGQCRRDGERLRRDKNDIVVFEGIHALNPEVTGAAGDYARCMYVSVRSRLELKDGELLHPCYIRLMRRLIRDGFFRGRSAAETLDMFDSVEAGENKYIMPYKHRAEFSVDTFHAYEPALYKNYLLDTLRRESRSYKDFERFLPMLKALEEIEPVMLGSVPVNSLAREFVGESSYSY